MIACSVKVAWSKAALDPAGASLAAHFCPRLHGGQRRRWSRTAAAFGLLPKGRAGIDRALRRPAGPGFRPAVEGEDVMGPIRDEIAALELTGISRVAVGSLHDPEVIPLWFGESDLVTPAFIRDAAKQALDEGR